MSDQEYQQFTAFRAWIRGFREKVTDPDLMEPVRRRRDTSLFPRNPYGGKWDDEYDDVAPVIRRIKALGREIEYTGKTEANSAELMPEGSDAFQSQFADIDRRLEDLQNHPYPGDNSENTITWIMHACRTMSEWLDQVEAHRSTTEAPLRKSDPPSAESEASMGSQPRKKWADETARIVLEEFRCGVRERLTRTPRISRSKSDSESHRIARVFRQQVPPIDLTAGTISEIIADEYKQWERDEAMRRTSDRS